VGKMRRKFDRDSDVGSTSGEERVYQPQEMSVSTCTISDDVKAKFKKFQIVGKDKKNSAFIMKIDPKTQTVIMDKEFEAEIGEIGEDLPEATPRYIAYSYKRTHPDGRVSYPLIFIFYCPPGISTSLNILYSSTKTLLVNELSIGKIFDVRSSDEINENWLKEKLASIK